MHLVRAAVLLVASPGCGGSEDRGEGASGWTETGESTDDGVTGARPTTGVSVSGGESAETSAGADESTGAAETAGSDSGASQTSDDTGDSGDTTDTSGQVQCDVWSDLAPQPGLSEPILVGDQSAWRHDEGHGYGFFHTYDYLVACPGAAERKIHVLLPRNYEGEDREYPVVYMNDGHTTFWAPPSANLTWDLAQRLSEADPCEQEPVIVVAVHPHDRDAEYTHAQWGNGSCCGIAEYSDYLADCLKPFIDANYRTRSDRASTATAGSSHGGLAAFLTATLRSDSFGKAIAMSSSFGIDLSQGETLADSYLLELASPALGNPATAPVLWIDWGLVREGGYHNEVIEALVTTWGEAMVALLQSEYGYVEGQNLFSFADEDGGHDENSWSTRIGPALLALFPRED